MDHKLLGDASFWAFLLTIDQDLAEIGRKKGCSCGGRLHVANDPRKPGGGPRDLPQEYRQRLSFCCDREGCRRRVTPPSVRFLGRRVYLGAVVILVAAMRQGPTPRRVLELTQLFRIDPRTIDRWRTFWNDHFPRSLLNAFLRGTDHRQGWGELLRFLSPITVSKGLEIKISDVRGQPAEDAHRQP